MQALFFLPLALGVFLVFSLAQIILYLIDRREAEKLSADLARYQQTRQDG